MQRHSIRDLLRWKREDKKTLSSEMRQLMVSFEAQYSRPDPQGAHEHEIAEDGRSPDSRER